jgi:hypothetical protein
MYSAQTRPAYQYSNLFRLHKNPSNSFKGTLFWLPTYVETMESALLERPTKYPYSINNNGATLPNCQRHDRGRPADISDHLATRPLAVVLVN